LIEDKTYEQAIRARLFEVMDDRNELGDYSTSDLHIMGKGIEKNLAYSLAGLNEQTVSA